MGEQPELKVFKAQKVSEDPTSADFRELLAQLCFYYPQYTYSAARKLPYKRVVMLVEMANRIEAKRFYNLTQIAAAPHTEKGKAVKQLLKEFKRQMDG